MEDFKGGTAVAGAGEEQKMIVFGVSYSTTKEAFRAYFAQVTALHRRNHAIAASAQRVLLPLSPRMDPPPHSSLPVQFQVHHVAPHASCKQSRRQRGESLAILAKLVPRSKVGRNTVTSGGPVTVTVTEPIPCYRSREGLFSVCLASGNQRRSCFRSRPPPRLEGDPP